MVTKYNDNYENNFTNEPVTNRLFSILEELDNYEDYEEYENEYINETINLLKTRFSKIINDNFEEEYDISNAFLNENIYTNPIGIDINTKNNPYFASKSSKDVYDMVENIYGSKLRSIVPNSNRYFLNIFFKDNGVENIKSIIEQNMRYCSKEIDEELRIRSNLEIKYSSDKKEYTAILNIECYFDEYPEILQKQLTMQKQIIDKYVNLIHKEIKNNKTKKRTISNSNQMNL